MVIKLLSKRRFQIENQVSLLWGRKDHRSVSIARYQSCILIINKKKLFLYRYWNLCYKIGSESYIYVVVNTAQFILNIKQHNKNLNSYIKFHVNRYFFSL